MQEQSNVKIFKDSFHFKKSITEIGGEKKLLNNTKQWVFRLIRKTTIKL